MSATARRLIDHPLSDSDKRGNKFLANEVVKDQSMASKPVDQMDLAEIGQLASDITKVQITATVKYDLMGHGLTTEDVCNEIVEWIDNNQSVKKVTLKGKHAGQAAFELKPKIGNTLFY